MSVAQITARRAKVGPEPQLATIRECANMLEIEPYRPADLPVIERFIATLHDAERQLDPRLSPGIELAADGLQRMLSDAADGKGLVLIARVDGIAVGFGCVLIDDYRDPSYVEAVRRRAYVSYLYVADEWRRKGIGRRLLDMMEAEAKRGGCARLVTRYKAVNAAAGRCYEAADFRPDQYIVSKSIGD
jgi:GNAT superfamily N-acetyltransferase